jgi:hypothetical protein
MPTESLHRRCPACGGTARVRLDDRLSRLFTDWAADLLAAEGLPVTPQAIRDAAQRWIDDGAENPGRFEGCNQPEAATEPRLVAAFGPLR